MIPGERGIPIREADRHTLTYGGGIVEVSTAVSGTRIDVHPELAHPEDFHGNTLVHHVVRFGSTLESLIGRYDGRHGAWSPDSLPNNGIVILEYYFTEAQKLMKRINTIAKRFVQDSECYDDIGLCKEYLELARAGYDMLRQHEGEFQHSSMDQVVNTYVSLERAGLVSTRLAHGFDLNEDVPKEVRVVTKRTHLKSEPPTHLTATVQWRDRHAVGVLNGATVGVTDFVNPASGASVAAFILTALSEGSTPRAVAHRSICLTQQGTMFNRQALLDHGIRTTFYSVGVADMMNDMYYLVGDRTVADAGHILRHFLPASYSQ